MASSAIEIKDLGHSYKGSVKPALQGVSFSVQKGEIFGLLGPNGGGKTTLFRILSTALKPSSGGASLFGLDVAKDAAQARGKIGVVFQHPSLDKKLTARENMLHQGRLYGISGQTLDDRIGELLGRVALTDRADGLVETLSGGMQRRLEIAKGMIHKPELLLMDEPSTGLDPGARRDLWSHLLELKGQGITILVTTHLMDEADKCDRVGILSEGKLVALDKPSVLKDEIGGEVIVLECAEPARLAREIKDKFSLETAVLDGTVRIEKDKGHEFVPKLVQAFPGDIDSVMLGKPTLEDVFIHRTGHKFWAEKRPQEPAHA